MTKTKLPQNLISVEQNVVTAAQALFAIDNESVPVCNLGTHRRLRARLLTRLHNSYAILTEMYTFYEEVRDE